MSEADTTEYSRERCAQIIAEYHGEFSTIDQANLYVDCQRARDETPPDRPADTTVVMILFAVGIVGWVVGYLLCPRLMKTDHVGDRIMFGVLAGIVAAIAMSAIAVIVETVVRI